MIKKIGMLNESLEGKKIRIRGHLKYSQHENSSGVYIRGQLTDDTGKIGFIAYQGTAWLSKILELNSECYVDMECVLDTVSGGKTKNLKQIRSISAVSTITPGCFNLDEVAIRKKLESTYRLIQNKKIKAAVANVMNRAIDGTILPAKAKNKPFFVAPYSLKNFSYRGGLSVYCASIIDELALLVKSVNSPYLLEDSFVEIDEDTLYASAILHAIGAIEAFAINQRGVYVETEDIQLHNIKNLTRTIVEEELLRAKVDKGSRRMIIHNISTCSAPIQRWANEDNGKTLESVLLNKAIEIVLLKERFRSVNNASEVSVMVNDSAGYLWKTKSLVNEPKEDSVSTTIALEFPVNDTSGMVIKEVQKKRIPRHRPSAKKNKKNKKK